MSFAIKRHQMMLAHRIEGNILLQYHLVIVYGEDLRQMFSRILIHTTADFFIHPADPLRCLLQSLSIGILPDSFQ